MKLHTSLLALSLAVSAQVLAAETPKQVNLYIWGEYLAPDTLSSFEEKTGIKVVVDHFDSLETVETKLLTGRSGYDLVLTAGQGDPERRAAAAKQGCATALRRAG